MKPTPTWAQTEDVSSVGVRPWQHCEKAQVEDVFHCGWLQVLEHLWPSLTSCMVIEEQLQGTVIVELPSPQEAQQEGIIKSCPEIGLFLQRGKKKLTEKKRKEGRSWMATTRINKIRLLTKQNKTLRKMAKLSLVSIHLSILYYFSRPGFHWQQSKQRCPVLLLPVHFL